MAIFLEYLHKMKHGLRMIAERKLELILKALKEDHLLIDDFTDDDHQPYIFVYDPSKESSFSGIRIYLNNEIIAFRVQKMPDTQPYGASYQLDIQQMLEDIMDNTGQKDKEKLAELLVELLGSVIRKFFIKSASAEKEQMAGITSSMPRDVVGNIVIKNKDNDAVAVKNSGTDYSNTVFSKSN